MPTVPDANAPFGSTHRPGQAILLIAPQAVHLAGRSSSSAAAGVLKAGFFKSDVSKSMPFIFMSGQYSQSKFSVRKPVFSPLPMACENVRSSAKDLGGAESPASLNIVLL